MFWFSPVHAAHSILKETVGVILSVSTFVQLRVRFTTVHFKPLNDQKCRSSPYISIDIQKPLLLNSRRGFMLKNANIYVHEVLKINITFILHSIPLGIEYLVFSRYM